MSILNKIVFFIIDIDGTLTDSGIYYDNNANEFKRFSTRDYVGILAAHYAEIQTVAVTGRYSFAVEKRVKEMGVDYLFQGIKNKKDFLLNFCRDNEIDFEQIGYIGDDLNDLSAMKLASFVACPADAHPDIKEIANYISPVNGGYGVISDVFRYYLKTLNKWDNFIDEVIENGF